ncbi:MAG: carbamoyl phosphate synthase small subunit [Rhodospirillaceae bacterium]|nr:carbamoyl phosphate synthase small subunit [Rhodospirillaceae bacterium]
MPKIKTTPATLPEGSTAALILADGSVFWGRGIGATGNAVGEICFNTSITGYQEILTDPSYAGQIINFTFPHIGNVGTNPEDIETSLPAVRGCVLRADITDPSNFRAVQNLDNWLKGQNLVGISGVDTRRVTRQVRDFGAPNGVITHVPDGAFDIAACTAEAVGWPGLEGMDLAREVSCTQPYNWTETVWKLGEGYGAQAMPRFRVVAVDFGAKRNILRCLAELGCAVTVVPATASADDILKYDPEGVFLSNGPGDPAATGKYAIPVVQAVIEKNIPTFGICLGYQILALALGAKTEKMHHGHRGANHPVKDLETGKVEITSQNHGFMVDIGTLPDNVLLTHQSLFDGTPEGFKVTDKPIFGVQHHPEASPGPQDSHYLFDRFVALMEANA